MLAQHSAMFVCVHRIIEVDDNHTTISYLPCANNITTKKRVRRDDDADFNDLYIDDDDDDDMFLRKYVCSILRRKAIMLLVRS